MNKLTTILLLMAILTGCKRQGSSSLPAGEDTKAKAMMQGFWVNLDDGNVSFRVKGDTIFYADTTSMPTYFQIIGDSLVLGTGAKYSIVKQAPHLFWFNNQNGDLIKLEKSDDPAMETEFVRDTPKVMTYTHQVKTDSVVMYNGERYHWYIAINPTKYKVSKRAYSEDGMEVENVYYDNIMHISVYQGAKQLFSSDFRKSQYADKVPKSFLEEAILGNMEFSHIDAAGLHFNATLCIPDGVSCYLVESLINFKGKMTMKLIEY